MGFPIRFHASKAGGPATYAVLAAGVAHVEWECWSQSWKVGQEKAQRTNTVAESGIGFEGHSGIYMLLPSPVPASGATCGLDGIEYYKNMASSQPELLREYFPHQTGNVSCEFLGENGCSGPFYCPTDCRAWNFGDGTCCTDGGYVPDRCRPLDAENRSSYCSEVLMKYPTYDQGILEAAGRNNKLNLSYA